MPTTNWCDGCLASFPAANRCRTTFCYLLLSSTPLHRRPFCEQCRLCSHRRCRPGSRQCGVWRICGVSRGAHGWVVARLAGPAMACCACCGRHRPVTLLCLQTKCWHACAAELIAGGVQWLCACCAAMETSLMMLPPLLCRLWAR